MWTTLMRTAFNISSSQLSNIYACNGIRLLIMCVGLLHLRSTDVYIELRERCGTFCVCKNVFVHTTPFGDESLVFKVLFYFGETTGAFFETSSNF